MYALDLIVGVYDNTMVGAASVQLKREQISELIGITAEPVEERKRIRKLPERLPETSARCARSSTILCGQW